jgi:hypothetical protein
MIRDLMRPINWFTGENNKPMITSIHHLTDTVTSHGIQPALLHAANAAWVDHQTITFITGVL